MTEPTTISTLEEHAKRIATEMMKAARGTDTEWREKQAENWGFMRAHIKGFTSARSKMLISTASTTQRTSD